MIHLIQLYIKNYLIFNSIKISKNKIIFEEINYCFFQINEKIIFIKI